MNLRHLRLLEAAGRLGSLNLAAQETRFSQSAVSYAIQSIEEEFGQSLLERSSNGSTLTAAGAMLCKRVENLLQAIDEAVNFYLAAETHPPVEVTKTARALSIPHLQALAQLHHNSLRLGPRHSGAVSPNVLRRVREVERLVEQTILVRRGKDLDTTKAALSFSRAIAAALKELDYARVELDYLHSPYGGLVSIGCASLASTAILPKVIRQFTLKHPHNRVKIFNDTFKTLHARLVSGELDVVIGIDHPQADADQTHRTFLQNNDFALVSRAGHPLLHLPRIEREDLLHHDWIIPLNGPMVRKALARMFGEQMRPRIAVETQSTAMAVSLLQSSDNIWLTSLATIDSYSPQDQLRVLPFEIGTSLGGLAIYTRAAAELPPLQASFVRLLSKSAQKSTERTTLVAARTSRLQSEIR